MPDAFYSSMGQGWPQLADLALAFVLTSIIGLERRARRKSAGLRTHALVGLGAALFMLVSKYGFADLMGMEDVSFDPSRIAAQVVSGVGFLGGGVIFLRRDVVRGLTTAAIVWVSAAVGMACGAGLPCWPSLWWPCTSSPSGASPSWANTSRTATPAGCG